MHKKILHSARRGFTLNELLVVIAIIGLLSGIVFVSVRPAQERAKNAKILADINQYIISARLYKEKETSYPNSGNQWQCLGPSGTTCLWSEVNISYNQSLSDSFSQVMSTLPSSKDELSGYRGYQYRSTGTNSFELRWFLYGEDQDCSPGTEITPSSGEITRCTYRR